MGVGEFTAVLTDLIMDLNPVGEAFGRWGVEKYREWELCCDALVVQWYAGQNFLAIKSAEEKFSDAMIRSIVKSADRLLSDYVIPDGIDPEMKIQVMQRIKNHRAQYDKLLTAGKNRNMLSADYMLDIGATFSFISGNMGSFKVRKLGTELYRATMDRCVDTLGNVLIEDKTARPETEEHP